MITHLPTILPSGGGKRDDYPRKKDAALAADKLVAEDYQVMSGVTTAKAGVVTVPPIPPHKLADKIRNLQGKLLRAKVAGGGKTEPITRLPRQLTKEELKSLITKQIEENKARAIQAAHTVQQLQERLTLINGGGDAANNNSNNANKHVNFKDTITVAVKTLQQSLCTKGERPGSPYSNPYKKVSYKFISPNYVERFSAGDITTFHARYIAAIHLHDKVNNSFLPTNINVLAY